MTTVRVTARLVLDIEIDEDEDIKEQVINFIEEALQNGFPEEIEDNLEIIKQEDL